MLSVRIDSGNKICQLHVALVRDRLQATPELILETNAGLMACDLASPLRTVVRDNFATAQNNLPERLILPLALSAFAVGRSQTDDVGPGKKRGKACFLIS